MHRMSPCRRNGNYTITADQLDSLNLMVLRFNETMAANLQSLDVHEHIQSHEPGFYAIILIGFVGAILNCCAIQILVMWIRYLKSTSHPAPVYVL